MAALSHGLPVSQILKTKTETDDEPKKKSREDWRKAKELEEARKAGTAPAAVDEEGKDINPHIPQYIATAPWYYGATGPTLKHQRPQEDKQKTYSQLDEWYKRGVDTTKVAIKYRKGACENCGAMTHKKKDCMERPRKVGAKYSGVNIAPDEHAQKDLALSYDGKRDRWSGYDPSEHRAIIEEFQKIEEAKRQLRAEKLATDDKEEEEEEEGGKEELDEEEDEDKYVDEVDMPGTKVDSKQRITVRNLRIREDTAKYLRNLDPNSAYYDPKTRSMRENPNPHKDDGYQGENFVRFTGDTTKHAKAQIFAWEAHGKGVDVHLLAEPTKLELLQKEYEEKKQQFKSKVQESVLEKYGGEEHLQAPPKSLLLAQTEDYMEYSRSGKIIKGADRPIVRSKYEEDVYINNHMSVWGSYWRDGKWGYKCCHSFFKNSYCLGETGKTLTQEAEAKKAEAKEAQRQAKESKESKKSSSSSSEDSSSSSDEKEKSKKGKKKKHKKKKNKEKKKGRKEEETNEEKEKEEKEAEKKKEIERLKPALEKEEKRQEEMRKYLAMDERKRPYNSMFEVKQPTDEEMEAYYWKRKREEDPMREFL